MKFDFIDLFCGGGGLGEGFREAGFRSVWALDMDQASCRTYKENFGHEVYCGQIESVKRAPTKADVVIGGPPCQGFSPLGGFYASAEEDHAKMNRLWKHFLRVAETASPRAFVIENVPEFLKSDQFKRFRVEAAGLGYDVAWGVLNAYEFGVPQVRKRGFAIGAKGFVPSLPQPSGQHNTVRQAIGDLPLIPTGNNWHIGRSPTPLSLERYRCVPAGGNRFDLMKRRPDITPQCWLNKKTGTTDVFGRLEWGKPASTIRTEFFKPEKGRYLHPQADRPITHREAARIQTFPDDYRFVGSKIEVAKMIGNAVPPKLASAIARHVRALIEGEYTPSLHVARPVRATARN